MTKLGNIALAGLLVLGAGACKKKDKGEGGGKVTEGSDKGSAAGSDKGSDTGSAAGSDKGSATGPATARTAEQNVARYQECWGYFNDRKVDDFKGCFTSDVVAKDLAANTEAHGPDEVAARAKMFQDAFSDLKGSPQLILADATRIAGVWLLTGTNDGVLKTPMGDLPATNKKIGMMILHGVELDADGKAKEQFEMMDMQSFMGQLGQLPEGVPFRPAMAEGAAEPVIAISKGDDTEKANLEADKASMEAFNAHNVDGMAAMMADDMTCWEAPMPMDMDKKTNLANMKMFFDGFSDVKMTPVGSWAAGDFTISAAQMSGTNDKPVKEMMLEGKGAKFAAPGIEITQRKDGKIVKDWIFYDGMGMWMQLNPEAAKAMGGGAPPADGAGGDTKTE